MPRSTIRRLAALFLASMIALATPAVMLGHAELKTPTPAADSVQTQPVTEVSGIYTEAMKKTGSSMELLDASGASVDEGGLDPTDDTRMVIDLDAPLPPGAYTVRWTAVAVDGHVERGEWAFTVAAPPTPSPTTRPTPSAAPATSSPTATAPPTPSPIPTPSPSVAPSPSADGPGTAGSSGDVLLPIIVALVILGAGAAYLLTRRNRPTSA